MNITKTEEENRITVKIEGWLDVSTTPELHDYLEKLPETQELYFDFSKLEYISSAGVREVVASYRKQKDCKGVFAVTNVSADVYDVFDMTGLTKKIDIREEKV